jgi:type II secretory pathway pseudopilin PulG
MPAGEPARADQGFTYIGVLFLIALLGLGLAGTGEAWSLTRQRERERELLWAGNQYARAVKAYYEQSPGVRRYPERLEDLLEDRRFPMPRHHLRQLYPDPVTREAWDLVLAPDGRIAGVRSRSEAAPLKQAGFPARWDGFKGMTRYSDWHFVAEGSVPKPPAAGAAPAARAP